ncbi:MAG: glutamate-1-semialdehyde 2,1-aminomutase [Bacteroidia bacterium]|nr:glutamate-1-semialdehyde 2,1-aminomutase [Bacteroidia bacterium]
MQKESESLFHRAQKVIPGGVNSPVRAFKSVGGVPVFIRSAEGAFLYDEDGNRYVDYLNSWGPMILGHAYPPVTAAILSRIHDSTSFGAPTRLEVEMAEQICRMVPGVEKVRMVNSGTEACMSAIRLARGYTGRAKIVKFAGCYHGHGDSFLIKAGSGAMTLGVPDSPGVTAGTAADTLLADFNDLEGVTKLIFENEGQVAAVIVEPVAGNMGCIPPAEGFLQGLRKICNTHGIILIFDEVMTGFRLAAGGAQEFLKVNADLVTMGKVIGGGMPVGAYGGKSEIMDFVAPAGPVYQAGTLSGNPIAMISGLTMLKELEANPETYRKINETAHLLAEGMAKELTVKGIPYQINQMGSMLSLHFTEQPVTSLASVLTSDTRLYGKFFHAMLKNGVYLPPSPFESWFVSAAISPEIQAFTQEAFRKSLREL